VWATYHDTVDPLYKICVWATYHDTVDPLYQITVWVTCHDTPDHSHHASNSPVYWSFRGFSLFVRGPSGHRLIWLLDRMDHGSARELALLELSLWISRVSNDHFQFFSVV
jgi:hypothetical protein